MAGCGFAFDNDWVHCWLRGSWESGADGKPSACPIPQEEARGAIGHLKRDEFVALVSRHRCDVYKSRLWDEYAGAHDVGESLKPDPEAPDPFLDEFRSMLIGVFWKECAELTVDIAMKYLAEHPDEGMELTLDEGFEEAEDFNEDSDADDDCA